MNDRIPYLHAQKVSALLPSQHSYDEGLLIRALADGDRVAYATLYSSYLTGLQQYVYLFTRDKDIAEEIVQDVFLTIWEKRTGLGGVGSFKAYLFRVAKNRLINHIRREQVRARAFGHLQSRAEGMSNSEDTLHQVHYRQTRELLQTAIGALPEKRKLVFLLSTEDGLSLDEIADRMGISKNVVKKQLYAAYDSIRGFLVEHGELSAWLILVTELVR